MISYKEAELQELTEKCNELKADIKLLRETILEEGNILQKKKYNQQLDSLIKELDSTIDKIDYLKKEGMIIRLYNYSKELSYSEQKELLGKISKAHIFLIDGYGKKYHKWFYKHIMPPYFDSLSKKKTTIIPAITTFELHEESCFFSIAKQVIPELSADESREDIIEKFEAAILALLEYQSIILPIQSNTKTPKTDLLKTIVTEFLIPVSKKICTENKTINTFIILILTEGKNKMIEIEKCKNDCCNTLAKQCNIDFNPIKEITYEDFSYWVKNGIIQPEGLFRIEKIHFSNFLQQYEKEKEGFLSTCYTTEGTLEKIFKAIDVDFEDEVEKISKT